MSATVFSTTILGHAVDAHLPAQSQFDQQANEWGLSRMQRMLLADTPWIRVVDAPTGAGKSYAFQKAVLPKGGRPGDNVLFVAPTRRLTENLAQSLEKGLLEQTRQLARSVGMDEHAHRQAISQSVMVWNGQQVIENAPQGRASWRKRQFAAIGSRLNLGRTVFTVLEIVRDMLFPTRLVAGEGDNRGSMWLSRFKHVVFDEFHTLGPDGLALALVVVAMVQSINRRERERAKKLGREPRYLYLTFLSATPVDVFSFLSQGLGKEYDIDEDAEKEPGVRLVELPDTGQGDAICLVSESLIHSDQQQWPSQDQWMSQSRYRPLHGDVLVQGVEADAIEDLVNINASSIVDNIAKGRQVVLLWDSKAQLMLEMQTIKTTIEHACVASGLARNPVFLEVHAAADRRRGEGGVPVDIEQADVILGTASVEAGVTFRDNCLLIMEPGFTLMNMVQRLGRCARGMINKAPAKGHVIIRLDPGQAWRNDYRPWLPCVIEALIKTPEALRVDEFLLTLRKSAWAGPDTGLYRQDGLDRQAQARASLFWAGCWLAFERNGKTRSREWMGNPPGRVAAIKQSLSRMEALLTRPRRARRNGGPANTQILDASEYQGLRSWMGLWRQESQALREIAPTIWVIDTDRKTHTWRAQPFDLSWLARFTTVLEDGDPCSIEEASFLLPNESWSESDVFVRLPPGREMQVLPRHLRKNRKQAPVGQNFLLPLGATLWIKSSMEAARISSEQLRSLAGKMEAKAANISDKEQGQNLINEIRCLARLVAETGRAVPGNVQLDSAAAAWCESLVV